MDSLQQLFEDYTKKFFTLDITSLGVTEFENQAITGFKEYLMKHMSLLIESVDNTLKEHPKLRENWTIHKKEKRLLVMQSGNLVFERRYFYNTKTDKYAFLTDNLIGIEANERVDKGLKVAICNEAANQSYFRTAKATCDGRVSKQTVQRITREIKLKELPGKDLSKEPLIPILHIQADEDHVAMQDGSNRWHRIAVAHEPRKKRGKKAIFQTNLMFLTKLNLPKNFGIEFGMRFVKIIIWPKMLKFMFMAMELVGLKQLANIYQIVSLF